MAEISSIATQSPLTIRPTDALRVAIDLMAKHGFRRLPVVFEYNLEGIITASDVLRVIYEGGVDQISKEVYNFMTPEPRWAPENVDIGEAIEFMFQNDLSSLPLLSERDRFLTGIVTERDLVKAFVDSIADADLDGFMTENPLKLSLKNKTVADCIKAMVDGQKSRIIFVNKNNKVEGIITVKDIIKYIQNEIITYGHPEEDIINKSVDDIVTKELITVNISQSVEEVAKFMLEKKIGGVPVVDNDDNFVGLFTERDILRLIGTYRLFTTER